MNADDPTDPAPEEEPPSASEEAPQPGGSLCHEGFPRSRSGGTTGRARRPRRPAQHDPFEPLPGHLEADLIEPAERWSDQRRRTLHQE